jgi:hypothetical protein
VLSTSEGHTNIAFNLTIPDYYFVLYWLRQNSYTKSTFTHTTHCTAQKHFDMIERGEKTLESLKVLEVVNRTTLQVNMLDQIPNPAVYTITDPYATLRPALVRDMLEISMSPNIIDPEFEWNAEMASYLTIIAPMPVFDDKGGIIGSVTRELNLEERIERMGNEELYSADDAFTIKQFSKTLDKYGVQESIKVRCKECGASWDSKMSLEAHSFLSAA